MLSDKGRKAEIARRARAGAAEIPKSRPDEIIVSMETIEESLYVFSQYNIFRIRTADDIDPEVTRANVPWAVNPYLSIGTQHRLIAGSFGLLQEFQKIGMSNEIKQKLSGFLMEFAVSAAELEYARHIYQSEVKSILEKGDPPKIVQSAIQIPRVASFEISFSIFFASAKRAIGKLLGMLEWAAGFPVKNGTMVDKYCNRVQQTRKLKQHHEIVERLRDFVGGAYHVNEIRNAFEHPTQARNVLLTNTDLLASGAIRMPTFTLTHDKIQLPPNEDFGAHLEAVVDFLSKFAEQATLVSVAMKARSVLPWRVSVRPDAEIDPNFPARWSVNISTVAGDIQE